jgi:hypothetical protein
MLPCGSARFCWKGVSSFRSSSIITRLRQELLTCTIKHEYFSECDPMQDSKLPRGGLPCRPLSAGRLSDTRPHSEPQMAPRVEVPTELLLGPPWTRTTTIICLPVVRQHEVSLAPTSASDRG